MTYTKQTINNMRIALYIVLSLVVSANVFAQDDVPTDLAKFLFVVETPDNKIQLTCISGCAWKQLSFTERPPQHIDQYGMTTLSKHPQTEDSPLANFLFTIVKTEDGVRLEGIEGTAWIDLSFSCPENNCNQAVDEMGMTTVERD